MIFTPDDVSDAHINVIDNYGEVVEGLADVSGGRSPSNYHIAAEVATFPTNSIAYCVVPRDCAIVINHETNHSLSPFGFKSFALFRSQIAMAVIIARSLLVGFLCFSHLVEFRRSGVAAVGESFVEESLDSLSVDVQTLGLETWAFIPIHP